MRKIYQKEFLNQIFVVITWLERMTFDDVDVDVGVGADRKMSTRRTA